MTRRRLHNHVLVGFRHREWQATIAEIPILRDSSLLDEHTPLETIFERESVPSHYSGSGHALHRHRYLVPSLAVVCLDVLCGLGILGLLLLSGLGLAFCLLVSSLVLSCSLICSQAVTHYLLATRPHWLQRVVGFVDGPVPLLQFSPTR